MENLYFIYGAEDFLVDEAINKIVSRKQAEYEGYIEVARIDVDEVKDEDLETYLEYHSLFALHRVLVFKNPWWLQKGTRKKKGNKNVVDILEPVIKNCSPELTLVFTSVQAHDANPLVKLLSAHGQKIQCSPLSPAKLRQWIQEKAKSNGWALEPEALALVVNSGQDMYYLDNFLQKMFLQEHRNIITRKDVIDQMENRHEIKIFRLSDAVMEGNTSLALQAYHQLVEQGVYPLVFLKVLSGQIINMAKVKYHLEQGHTPVQIEKELGIKGFMLKKLSEKARRFSWQDIETAITRILYADIDFKKSNKDEQLVLEMMIIDLCTKKPAI